MKYKAIDAIKNRLGTILAFFGGTIFGGITISRDFTIRMGDFSFSTNDTTHARALLREKYIFRVQQLKRQSDEIRKTFESDTTTCTIKEEALKQTIRDYLAPISHAEIFGKDVIIFDDDGKSIIFSRKDYYQMLNNLNYVLDKANMKKCVDEFKFGQNSLSLNKNNINNIYKTCTISHTP